MATKAERRALFLETDENHDAYIGIDVNEYLIETFPSLTLRQRRAIWTRAQNEDLIDFSVLEDQIDQVLVLHAERDQSIDLSLCFCDDDEDEDEDDEQEEEEEDVAQ